MADTFPAGVKPFNERKRPGVICMFDVDKTLSMPRQLATKEMRDTLEKLREYTVVAFVGGSDLKKITEQLEAPGTNGRSPPSCPCEHKLDSRNGD